MTIRTRMTLWYSGLLATVIIVFSVSLFSLLSWTWRAQLTENMRTAAEKWLKGVVYDSTTGDISSSTRPEASPMQLYGPMGVQIWHANGEFADSNISRQPPFDQQALGMKEESTRDVTLEGYHFLAFSSPIQDTTGRVVGTIQIISPLDTIDEAMARLLRIMGGVSIVTMLLSFMVGSVIAAQALQPIDAISNAAKQITAADDLSKRIPYVGPSDELGQLTQTFNATLERLEKLFNVQRRFVADVSHELRTPLTTIQGNLDLIKRYGNDPESLEAIESESKRMTRLVGDLLMLAQADAGRLPLREGPVELDAVTREVFRDMKLIAGKVNLTLGTVEHALINGDPDRLKQLIINLVTNAIKYTPEGGSVTLSMTTDRGFAYVRVSDTGIGIPKENLEHIFDRFYRVDKARARAMGGAGLGLSIVRWIVEAHRGRVWAESDQGKGSTFTVQLPRIDTDLQDDSLRDTQPAINIRAALKRRQMDRPTS